MDCEVFWLPKRDNFADKYEDSSDFDLEAGRFALADGAAESVFAGDWSQMLAREFVATTEESPLRWDLWLPRLQQSWAERYRGRELPWYTEEKLQQGAFATFVTLPALSLSSPGEPLAGKRCATMR